MRRDFTLLLASQKNATVLLLNGFLPIARLDYAALPLTQPALLHCHYDGKLRAVVADEREGGSVLHLAEYEAGVLLSSKEHLIKVSCLLGYIGEILSFV